MNERKVVLFAFNGEPMCFVHALLNAKDLHGAGVHVRLIIEGSATALVQELASPERPFHKLYIEIREAGLIDGVCKACGAKMGALQAAETQGLRLLDEMAGHPSLRRYLDAGYEIITF